MRFLRALMFTATIVASGVIGLIGLSIFHPPHSQKRSTDIQVVHAGGPARVADKPVEFSRPLVMPVKGVKPRNIRDTFNEARGSERRHEALDIAAAKGTEVIATDDGVVKKLFLSKAGGITIYQFDPTGVFCYYYAHLDRYAEGIAEGTKVERGDVIGYVGTTGNAAPDAPHLHFAIFQLGPEKRWWQGTPINPYPILANQDR